MGASFVALACGGHLLVRRYVPVEDLIEHNEVAGFIVAVVGVIYAVLLAFVTVIVWENYSNAESRASQEVDAVTDVWRLAAYLKQSSRRAIDSDLRSYVAAVKDDEWPKMSKGESSAEAQRSIVELLGDVVNVPLETPRDGNLQHQMLERVQLASDLRRSRINENGSGVPTVLWIALYAGAATTIGFLYLFGLKKFQMQLIMTGATALMIGLGVGVILSLDFPFRGDVSISPERWVTLNDMLMAGQVSDGPASVPAQKRATSR
jgi:hypothetical protein